jgi:proline iminopeptidase
MVHRLRTRNACLNGPIGFDVRDDVRILRQHGQRRRPQWRRHDDPDHDTEGCIQGLDNEYAARVLMPSMDQTALAEIKRLEDAKDFENPRYMELLVEHHYVHHVLRMPADEWPDPVNRAFARLNQSIYVPMQGPSELGASGKLVDWDRTADLPKIEVPTLVIGARYDTMDPAYMEMMAGALKNGRYLYCPNGSHMAMYDDQGVYFAGVIEFIRDVDGGVM